MNRIFDRLFVMTFAAATALASLACTGCSRPFDVKTAPGFVELDEHSGSYDYRATTPDGVVMAVRTVPLAGARDEPGALEFWTRAVTRETRDLRGYALVGVRDVASRDGTKGKELRFGHDEDGKPFAYWLTLFVAQDRLFVVEAGGAKEAVERTSPSLEWMHKSVRVKCDSAVSPVLASRTCNRW